MRKPEAKAKNGTPELTRKRSCKDGQKVAVISDTHGTLPSEAIKIMKGADLIIHAGDIDTPDVLEALRRIGPVVAVQGNMDGGPWTKGLSRTQVVEIGEVMLYVLHNVDRLDLDPRAAQFDAVISGHTHRPLVEENGGVLYLNPGSAGWPKANQPPTMALLCVKGRTLTPEIVVLG